MNIEIFFSCILCNKIGVNFQCERCNETYCSRDCQAVHWPIHRRMCFPMPDLIPIDDQMLASLNLKSSPEHQYPTTSAVLRRQSAYKLNSSDWVTNTKKSLKSPIVSRKSRFFAHLSPEKLCPDSFSLGSEEIPIETKFQPKKWYEEFLFGQVTEVIVQYFADNPTNSCWVIQRNDIDRRDAISKSLNVHRDFDALDSDDIKLDQVYNVQFEGVCYRGLVMHRLNPSEVWVRLIDNGRSFRARNSAIRRLHQMLPTDLKGLAFEINFETLLSLQVDEVLRVENLSANSNGAIDVKFVERNESFSDKDIVSIPLPINVPLELFCLDYSNVHLGYISVCQHDRKTIESISEISDKIEKYCERTESVNNHFCPKLNELCLAYTVDDEQWYRAKCVEYVLPDVYRLEMIDYGAVEEVNSKNIRGMVKDFIEPPVIQHHCTIFGIPHRPERDVMTKIVGYLSRNPIFCVTRAILCGGQYIIYVPDLLKPING